MTTTTEHITFTPEALETVSRMIDRARLIGEELGPDHPAATKASTSLLISLQNMFRLGGKITQGWHIGTGNPADILSLDGWTGHIEYGVVFHRRTITVGEGEFAQEYDKAGEWSVHS